ncbi:DUF1657 domain-containing protein [Bacillus shivajii]|uniref:DUF1657 domain-containing protein n=1 Tax=Bacillus shivajii TaxID=1983719 RepID=UPI001CFA589E|nr:DUF1657 domain-containing protein [Bacillus shivajii]UCZ51920.1 DUF1657 domain-containing protein [Bacillus shivajii]
MTVASNVKQCLASLKNAEATLHSFAIKSEDEDAKETFKESCLSTRRVIEDLEKRISQLEFEEPQYKGF